MRYPNEEIENYRRNAGERENVLIDEFLRFQPGEDTTAS